MPRPSCRGMTISAIAVSSRSSTMSANHEVAGRVTKSGELSLCRLTLDVATGNARNSMSGYSKVSAVDLERPPACDNLLGLVTAQRLRGSRHG